MVKTSQTHKVERHTLELLQHRLSVIGLWVDRLPHQMDQSISFSSEFLSIEKDGIKIS